MGVVGEGRSNTHTAIDRPGWVSRRGSTSNSKKKLKKEKHSQVTHSLQGCVLRPVHLSRRVIFLFVLFTLFCFCPWEKNALTDLLGGENTCQQPVRVPFSFLSSSVLYQSFTCLVETNPTLKLIAVRAYRVSRFLTPLRKHFMNKINIINSKTLLIT